MRSVMHSVLFISFAAWAVVGCAGEAASPASLQATEQPLQDKGVYYLQASGTAKSAMFAFYDQNKAVIGDGRSSQNPEQTVIHWRGNTWEGTGGPFTKNGAVVGSDGPDAVERDTVLTVFELSVDQTFPPDPSTLADQVQPNVCPNRQPCSRPSWRCTGPCTGWECSQTGGATGICFNPH